MVSAEHTSAELFQRAEPVWAYGTTDPRMDILGFRTVFVAKTSSFGMLRIAGWTSYRVWLNGRLIHYGPARAAKGFFRVENIDLAPFFDQGNLHRYVLAIEVVGYGVETFSHIKQRPFLQAEVTVDSRLIAFTDPHAGGFITAHEVTGRMRKVQRYSYMRGFSESYNLANHPDRWKHEPNFSEESLPLEIRSKKKLLPRRVPLQGLTKRPFQSMHLWSAFTEGAMPSRPSRDRTLDLIGKGLEGYLEWELETCPWLEFQHLKFSQIEPKPLNEIFVHEALTFKIDGVSTGIIELSLDARNEPAPFDGEDRGATRVWLVFDEILGTGSPIPDPLRGSCVNIIELYLDSGRTVIQSAEPYTLQYLSVVCLEGSVLVKNINLLEVKRNALEESFDLPVSDPALASIYHAGIRTLEQNSFDLYMDCPGRERAGYLCDSYFTARSGAKFLGDIESEICFLENFALAPKFDGLPIGMIPMCYPSDTLQETYIPQWPMWLVLQVADFQNRAANNPLIASLKPKLKEFIVWLEQYENEFELLESMPGWNFVEWSKANEFTKGVNFPTNMLYVACLKAFDSLYSAPELLSKGLRIQEKIVQISFDGEFFADNATRVNGQLERTSNRSSICQHLAFFFEIMSRESHPLVWEKLVSDLYPGHCEVGVRPEIAEMNMFVGCVVRWDLLISAGLIEIALAEIKGQCYEMALRTKTLWENRTAEASCCHGFASYISLLIDRGLNPTDRFAKVQDFS